MIYDTSTLLCVTGEECDGSEACRPLCRRSEPDHRSEHVD